MNKKIKDGTIPLFSFEDGKIITIGTAILLYSQNKKFILTARHVVESKGISIYLPSENDLMGLEANMVLPFEGNNKNQRKQVDLVILEPSVKNLSVLSKLYEWIPISIESAKYVPHKNDECILIGIATEWDNKSNIIKCVSVKDIV